MAGANRTGPLPGQGHRAGGDRPGGLRYVHRLDARRTENQPRPLRTDRPAAGRAGDPQPVEIRLADEYEVLRGQRSEVRGQRSEGRRAGGR